MIFDFFNSFTLFFITIFLFFITLIVDLYYDLCFLFYISKLLILNFFKIKFVFFIFENLKMLFSFFKQTKFFNMLWLCLISFLIFIFIVLVRIVTPRFKIETLSKLGWTYGLIILVLSVLFFFFGYFNF